MCILTFYKPGITPDLDALRDGALANPHGHGYAVVAGNRILTGHGLDAESTITEFAATRARFPDQPALFHSRLATHGTVDLANCHPFRLGGDKRTVLAHNGILPEIVHPQPADPRSDTRIAAEDFLPRQPFGPLDSWSGRARLERWLGTDKMIVLTVDPAYKHTAYLFNEHHGYWSTDQIWYSNHSYRWRELPNLHRPSTDLDAFCDYCGELDLDRRGPHCRYCGFCADCWHDYPHCNCPALEGTERYDDMTFTDVA